MIEAIEYANKVYLEGVKRMIKSDFNQLKTTQDLKLKLLLVIKIGSTFDLYRLNNDEITQIMQELEEEKTNER